MEIKTKMETNQTLELTQKETSDYYKILVKTYGKKKADEIWANRDPEIIIESLESLAEEDEGPLY